MKPYPRHRVTGETVREVIARSLLEDVKDPRVEFVTVTGVNMTPDLRHANVFVVAHGGADEYRSALEGLTSAKGRLKATLAQAVRMRNVPDLHFMIDPSLDEAVRITELIQAEHTAGRVPAESAETADEEAEDD